MGFFGKLRLWKKSKKDETQHVIIHSERSASSQPRQKESFRDEEGGAEPSTRYSKMNDRNSKRGKNGSNPSDGLQNDQSTSSTGSSRNKKWLWMEHTFFFAGSFLFMVSASLELATSKGWRGTPNNDNRYGDDVYARAVLGPWGWFSTLQILASFCFLIHAALHFIIPSCEGGKDTTLTPVMSDEEEHVQEMGSDARKCAMIFFGIGALFFAITSFLDIKDEIANENEVDNALEMTYMVAIHFFFLSALCNLAKDYPYFVAFKTEMDHVKTLVVADCLFSVATFVPLVFYYIEEDEDTYHNWLVASRWNLSTAVLWLVVGILYLVSVALTP